VKRRIGQIVHEIRDLCCRHPFIHFDENFSIDSAPPTLPFILHSRPANCATQRG
jgi:hypothetical protein